MLNPKFNYKNLINMIDRDRGYGVYDNMIFFIIENEYLLIDVYREFEDLNIFIDDVDIVNLSSDKYLIIVYMDNVYIDILYENYIFDISNIKFEIRYNYECVGFKIELYEKFMNSDIDCFEVINYNEIEEEYEEDEYEYYDDDDYYDYYDDYYDGDDDYYDYLDDDYYDYFSVVFTLEQYKKFVNDYNIYRKTDDIMNSPMFKKYDLSYRYPIHHFEEKFGDDKK